MDSYLQEVLDVHVLIECWLGQGEGSAEALMIRFAAELITTPPGGEEVDYLAMSCFFHRVGAVRPESHIAVDQAKIISEWYDSTAV